MPLVKEGNSNAEAGDLAGALALYQMAMDGFRAAGMKRPKLKEKMDEVKTSLVHHWPASLLESNRPSAKKKEAR